MPSDAGTNGRLAGKVAVITGAAQGIGRGIGRAFATQGAHVAVLDVNEDGAAEAAKECAARGPDASAWRCDVADRAEVDATVASVVERFGGIDTLVTCALPTLKVEPF